MRIRLFGFALVLIALTTLTSSWRTCCAAQVTTPQPAGVVLTGSVVDGQLNPLEGVVVEVSRNAVATRRATTDAGGTFRIEGLSTGTYRVRASKSGYPAAERPLVVGANAASLILPLVLMRPEDELAARADDQYMRSAQMAMPSPQIGLARPIAPPPPGAVAAEPAPRVIGAAQNNAMLGGIADMAGALPQRPAMTQYGAPVAPARGEGYAHVEANRFQRTSDEPLSTFGADVDTASFANVRRFIRNGQLPPTDAVRVEELINYFRFDYAAPRDGHPIGVTTEVGDCPWDPRHKLVLVGARAIVPDRRESPRRNIVLLVDVSGSMSSPDKLPLVKSGLGLFVNSLEPTDSIAIVTYAGASGIVLPPTAARDRHRILAAIADLGAGGSTNGAQGIITAYRLARQAFVPGGVNRVMLATDGDFNVGVTSQEGLLKLIEREKSSGVFLSVLGVGTGNLQDATMEMLADKGNGHYAYLDSLQEANRVLVREAGSTLETVAKDVKFQVEFNPTQVAAWKLVGYENRLMAHRDFNDDRKDGGELGAGHTVTVLYEIVPVGATDSIDDDDEDPAVRPAVDPLRYQSAFPAPATPRAARTPAGSSEMLTVKVRYQEPEGTTSRLLSHPVRAGATMAPRHLPFAALVAEYGLLLGESRPNAARWDALERRLGRLTVTPARQADRDALVELVSLASELTRLQDARVR